MLYELGLIATIAISSWISLDLLLSADQRPRSVPLGALAAAVGVWATGGLLVRHATTPSELLATRRLLFLGVCAVAPCCLWIGAKAARPRWWRRAPWLVAVASVPNAIFYSTLFWGTSGLLVASASSRLHHGALFPWLAGWSWVLVVSGCVLFFETALRLHRQTVERMALLATAVLIPLLGNAVYVSGALGMSDPTPLFLGVTLVLLRVVVVDSGLALNLPMARSDVIEQLEVGILVADLEEHVVDANGTARRLLGIERPLGLPLKQVLSELRARPGRAIEVKTLPLRSPVACVGVAAVLTDRTDAAQAEQQLHLAARLESLGFLTAGIAHEVNNPLGFVRANLSLLEKLAQDLRAPEARTALPEPARDLAAEALDLVSEAREGVERIARLAARLMTFARGSSDRHVRRAVDLLAVVDKAAALAGVGLPADWLESRVTPVPSVSGDEDELVQIVLNLLVNAVQAAGEHLPVELELAAEAEWAVLRVLDHGAGIAAADLPHLFDPFFTTKPPGKGTGLGLALSHDLARRHGGRLEASPRPGGGAVFALWLPLQDEASRPEEVA